MKEEFRSAIDSHAGRLSSAKSKKVIIEGHTDERGGREYNLALGQRRAEAVSGEQDLIAASAGGREVRLDTVAYELVSRLEARVHVSESGDRYIVLGLEVEVAQP